VRLIPIAQIPRSEPDAVLVGCAVPYLEVIARSDGLCSSARHEGVWPGAFRQFMQRPHVVVARVNHEGQALGSTQDGRLRFWETPHGLCFRLSLPAAGRETRRIADATRRREIKGASVAWQLTRGSRFRSKTVGGIEWIVEGDITEVSLALGRDVRPAYKRTSVMLKTPLTRRRIKLAFDYP
jgi:HK97 family phage prohead protease